MTRRQRMTASPFTTRPAHHKKGTIRVSIESYAQVDAPAFAAILQPAFPDAKRRNLIDIFAIRTATEKCRLNFASDETAPALPPWPRHSRNPPTPATGSNPRSHSWPAMRCRRAATRPDREDLGVGWQTAPMRLGFLQRRRSPVRWRSRERPATCTHRRRKFMPLSVHGLCDAEMTTPGGILA